MPPRKKQNTSAQVAQVIQKPPKRKVTFFHLPAELRNRIYHMHVHNEGFRIVGPHDSNEKVALGQISRQARAEFLPIYYAANSLSPLWPSRLGPRGTRWLDAFGPELIPLAKRFMVDGDSRKHRSGAIIVLRDHLHGFEDAVDNPHTESVKDDNGSEQAVVGGKWPQDVAIVAGITRRFLQTREDGSVFLPKEAIEEMANALTPGEEAGDSRS